MKILIVALSVLYLQSTGEILDGPAVAPYTPAAGQANLAITQAQADALLTARRAGDVLPFIVSNGVLRACTTNELSAKRAAAQTDTGGLSKRELFNLFLGWRTENRLRTLEGSGTVTFAVYTNALRSVYQQFDP